MGRHGPDRGRGAKIHPLPAPPSPKNRADIFALPRVSRTATENTLCNERQGRNGMQIVRILSVVCFFGGKNKGNRGFASRSRFPPCPSPWPLPFGENAFSAPRLINSLSSRGGEAYSDYTEKVIVDSVGLSNIIHEIIDEIVYWNVSTS